MPSNTPIPDLVVGAVLTAADWDTLDPLNTSIGLFAVGPATTGGKPSADAPNWLMQTGGSEVVALGASSTGSITFPDVFPGGLVSVVITPNDVSADQFTQVGLLTKSASGFSFIALTGGGATLYPGNVSVDWVAIGW